MTLQAHTRKLAYSISFIAICLSAVPVFATQLIGSGNHLPIPAFNPTWPPGQSPAQIGGTGPGPGGSFTGTWTAPVQSDWVGTFNAMGPIPSSMAVGIVNYDFTSLPLGYLPSGTFFIFGDVDQGSTLSERADLKAHDGSGNLLTTPWLNKTYAVRGPGNGPGNTVILGDMPGWSWDHPATPNTYVINGSTVNTSNPNVAFALVTNRPIHKMELNKRTTHFGVGLQAPVVPEPSTLAIACLGVLLLVYRRRW